jgi:DNA-binding MarR family transcriptional regulator
MAEQESIHRAILCLGRLAELFTARRQRLASGVGLTEHQWGVLEESAKDDFMPSMFARKRESTKAAVSKTLRQLIEKGLIRGNVHPADARQRDYALTARGKRVLEQLRRSRELAIAEVWQKLEQRTVEAFAESGEKVAEALAAYHERAGAVGPVGLRRAPRARSQPSRLRRASAPNGLASGALERQREPSRLGRRAPGSR